MDRERGYYSRVLQAGEQSRKKQKLHTSGSPEGGCRTGAARKDHRNNPKNAKKRSTDMSTAAGAGAVGAEGSQ